MTVWSRYFVHAIVFVVAIALSGYASISKELSQSMLRLGVVNAQGQALGQGGTTGSVELGRAGTIIKPVSVPTSVPVQHNPTLYTVRPGEDVYAIARKFNLSADEVRWSNPEKLTRSDVVRPGDKLQIPPLPGIVVVARLGETAFGIADRYKVDAQVVIDFNYLRNPDRLNPGDVLIVPNGRGPTLWPRRASDQPPRMGLYSNAKFTYGYCTWYVASRRHVPWTGDAWMWFSGARAMGFQTGAVPEPGAIMVTWENTYYGHVAYVEQVNADGSFVVSEMNYEAWGVINTRYIRSASQVPLIGFIY